MKKYILIFLICYLPISIFFYYFFGNMNFFGEQGFHHMTFSDILAILFWWSMPSSLFVSGIIYTIIDSIKK